MKKLLKKSVRADINAHKKQKKVERAQKRAADRDQKQRAEKQALEVSQKLQDIQSSKIQSSEDFNEVIEPEKTIDRSPRHLPEFAFSGLPEAKLGGSIGASLMNYRCPQGKSVLKDEAERW